MDRAPFLRLSCVPGAEEEKKMSKRTIRSACAAVGVGLAPAAVAHGLSAGDEARAPAEARAAQAACTATAQRPQVRIARRASSLQAQGSAQTRCRRGIVATQQIRVCLQRRSERRNPKGGHRWINLKCKRRESAGRKLSVAVRTRNCGQRAGTLYRTRSRHGVLPRRPALPDYVVFRRSAVKYSLVRCRM